MPRVRHEDSSPKENYDSLSIYIILSLPLEERKEMKYHLITLFILRLPDTLRISIDIAEWDIEIDEMHTASRYLLVFQFETTISFFFPVTYV
jgi:hypothetical protein